ncbi:MAG: hypothetical protein HWQ41_29825 [Nostoc sp. NOS(2021)]|uniref:hypothetical protein n=1 Tax=Nostoc sp. NOS(2021) TaxID=2815407 RepID=UPI0025E672BA|nr:hypothetical protein [Nostoc sp. NOS(2021)]MBN3899321.1 hypothetical protein [Nostoc sp. NOS(2021)]
MFRSRVIVSHNDNSNTISSPCPISYYFDDGNQITIQLKAQVITDSKNIEGFGKLGQYPLNRTFSVGLVYDNDWTGSSDSQFQQSNPLDGLWKISLE